MHIIITGASSGFGAAIARRFAHPDNQLWLCGRREERLQQLQADLSANAGGVFVSTFDIRDKTAVATFEQEVSEVWKEVNLLVNNAGLALGSEPIDEGDTDDWDCMIDTNLKGLLYMSRAFAPWMRRQRSGQIINIGSTAGKVVYQNGNVYCATKFAVDALSQAMRIDLLPYGVKVTAINPGMAETEFSIVRYKGDRDKAKRVYENILPLQAADVAEVVAYCAHLPAHVCINDLTLTCTAQANSVYRG